MTVRALSLADDRSASQPDMAGASAVAIRNNSAWPWGVSFKV